MLHFSRAWTIDGDPFLAGCGCTAAPCGGVDSAASTNSCPDHGPTKTIRNMHAASACPAG